MSFKVSFIGKVLRIRSIQGMVGEMLSLKGEFLQKGEVLKGYIFIQIENEN